MKLISFEVAGRSSFGIVDGTKVIDLSPRLDGVQGLEELVDAEVQARAAAPCPNTRACFSERRNLSLPMTRLY